MRTVLVAALAASAMLLAAASASGGDVQTFRVVDAGRPETQAFSPDVFLTIESPGPYVSQSPGLWAGPAYWAANQPAQSGTATLGWSVAFRDRSTDIAATAAAADANGWPLDQHFNISVPLFVSGRLVGTLPAYAVVTQAPGDQRARFEASLAVPLGVGAQAVVHLTTPTPAADTSAWGPYLVGGTILASTWNRGQILQALTLVRVEGNLAPKTISIRADRGTRAVRGKVVDPFYNPLVGVRIVEQRWTQGTWKTARAGHTDAAGTYRLPAGKGRFRTLVANGGAPLTSAAVEIP